MALATKLGLVAIWRATKWPDFCTARDTPYDRRALAEKLAASNYLVFKGPATL
jgi:hypothetical protein